MERSNAIGEAAGAIVGKALGELGPGSGLAFATSFYRSKTPKLYADIDRVRAQQLDVPMRNVFETLQVFLGSLYVNDFNYLGRTYRVTAQADAPSGNWAATMR